MKIKPIKLKPVKIKTIKFKPLDSDRDGVRDSKDCQPFNPNKQDWNMLEAKQSPSRIEYMEPDKYIKMTGADPKSKSYFEKYYDTEKGEGRPIKELSEHIKNPNKKIDIPYVGERGFIDTPHEGRHRAYAAKIAGMRKIPVLRPSLAEYSDEMREKLGEEFIFEAFTNADKGYKEQWMQRFRTGFPEGYMDGRSKKIYLKILRKHGIR